MQLQQWQPNTYYPADTVVTHIDCELKRAESKNTNYISRNEFDQEEASMWFVNNTPVKIGWGASEDR